MNLRADWHRLMLVKRHLNPRPAWIAILPVLVLVTAVNINKAVHIDDTAYLEIAERIVTSPLHATSGMLNWRNVSEPIHRTNQPHLFFYLLAGWLVLFGSGEIATHALMAIISVGAILAFWFLAKQIAPGKEGWLVALLFTGPAFLPAQNLMVDVPLLLCTLVFFAGLLVAMTGDDRGWIVAGLASAAAVLTKYTALILLPILVVAAGLRRRWRQLWVLSLPMLALACWSLLNFWDYGGIHVMERPARETLVTRFLVRVPQLIVCLGSVTPFTALITARCFKSRRLWVGYGLLCAALGVVVAILVGSGFRFGAPSSRNPEAGYEMSLQVAALSGLFCANGLWILGGAVSAALDELTTSWTPRMALLLLWLVGMLLFLAAYAPFMAVRHVLLIIPPLLLILGRSFELSRRSTRTWATLILSCGLGVALAVSDWVYADVYRTQARLLREQLGQQSTVWYVGHWGWQWYARQQRMSQYETGISHLREGDFLIQPYLVDRQGLDPNDGRRLALVRRITVESNRWTLIRTMSLAPPGGLYSSTVMGLPWRLSNAPLEQFDVFRVLEE